MKSEINGHQRMARVLLQAVLFFMAVAAVNVSQAQQAEEAQLRVSVTRQGAVADRDQGMSSGSIENSFAALNTEDAQKGFARSSAQSKATTSQAQTPDIDFWFYSADVELHLDRDADGYFHSIDLWFDADTWYDEADVYAVAYLSYEGGPWNEFAATDDFTIYGSSSDDDYFIETDLMSGYPAGSYDLLVELFDAYDGSFLASFGPDDSSDLGFLPLEDAERDAPVIAVRSVVVRQGGGSTGLLMLLLLAGITVTIPRSVRGLVK